MKRWILLLAALIAACSIIPAFALAGEATLPQLSAVSTIFGSGDTGGKTTVKHILVTAEGPGDQTIRYSDPETGERKDYPVYNEDGTLFEVEQPPVFYTGSAAPVAPAIANAVNMATGIYLTELPLDPEHLWRAMHGLKDDRIPNHMPEDDAERECYMHPDD